MEQLYNISDVIALFNNKHRCYAKTIDKRTRSRIISFIKSKQLTTGYQMVNNKKVITLDQQTVDRILNELKPSKNDYARFNRQRQSKKQRRQVIRIYKRFPLLDKRDNVYDKVYKYYYSAKEIYDAILPPMTEQKFARTLANIARDNAVTIERTALNLSTVPGTVYLNKYHLVNIPILISLFKKQLKTVLIPIHLTVDDYNRLRNVTDQPNRYLQEKVDNIVKEL